uniref:Endosome-associated-trafficking regulator 1 n=1 Tax=Malurus cyaneus samueli TaxID=2593467 RepID=A0A8C5TD44_9PASS
MIYPESEGLKDDDDDGEDDDSEELGNSSHSECPSPSSKSKDTPDDNQTEDLGKRIPFPLTPKHPYMVKDKRVGLVKHAPELEEEGQEFQEPFYKVMETSESLTGDEEPSPTYHLPGHQRLPAVQMGTAAANGSPDSFQHRSGQDLGTQAPATQGHANDHYVGCSESTTGAEPCMLHEEAGEDRESPSLHLTYDMLRKENSMLRSENKALRNGNLMLMSENFSLRQVLKRLKKDSAALMEQDVVLREEYNELRRQYDRLRGENAALRKDNAMVRSMFNTFQNDLKRQACTVSSLQDQLKGTHAEHEREARELQSLVQQTEHHLQLMTQRALDAEMKVESLKQKIFILQGQLERSKLGNENLRAEWPGSSEVRHRFHQSKPPRVHNGHKWLPQAAPASGMLPVVAEVLASTRKIGKGEEQRSRCCST